MANTNLQVSKEQRQDEFYTQLSTVEDELKHYRNYFKDKVIFCNADDPAFSEDGKDHFGDGQGGYTSNFFRYFMLNFEQLGIKKLITTHYDPNKPTYKLELVGDRNNDGKINNLDVIKTPLKQNGDFRSPECIELLKECDIVITNPPFSLMKEYLPLLIKEQKEFIVLGNINHITLKEITPYLLQGTFWLGYNSGHFWFRVPEYYEDKKTDFKIDESGQKWRRMGNCCWLTNIDTDIRHQNIDLYKKYNEEDYPKYDDYDVIHIETVKDIPEDYDGVMAVPLTFITKYNPEQFELLGVANSNRWVGYECKTILNGKNKYQRLLIRKR